MNAFAFVSSRPGLYAQHLDEHTLEEREFLERRIDRAQRRYLAYDHALTSSESS